MLCTELRLGDASAHDACGGLATGDDVAHLVDDLGAAPLLVRQGLDAELALLALDELHVGRGAALGVVAGEEVDAEGIAMETGEGDELPAEAQLRQVPDEGFHLGIRHAGAVPVEGGAKVVGQHLVRRHSTNLRGELRGLAQDGLAGLHPDAVGVRNEGDGALDTELRGTLDPEVALHGAGDVPVEVHVSCAERRGRLPHLGQAHLQGVLQPLRGVCALGLERLGHGVRVGHAAGTLLPVLVRAILDRLVERLHAGVSGSLDVGVVDGVDVGVDHRGGLGVGARHDDQGGVAHVGLQADGDEALRVLPSGDKDLAAHVAALLGARLLVLDVDAAGAVLDEHLRELHGGGDAAVAGVRVGDDRIEVVHDGGLGPVLRGQAAALLVLLAVVEELGAEELVHLVGHRVVGVVRDVGPRLVGGRGRGAALPAADVDGGQIFGHLHHLHGVQSSEGV
mmetsp:Transcript_40457/g.104674  ORF Transcript_40457/g.104674 Transcript_40457/m.104674 type:complete len:452 (-) Transcript_40457:157-1512(-)